MTAQEVIQALKSATVDEIAHIRSLLRVPEGDYQRHEYAGQEMPRNLADVWNRRPVILEPDPQPQGARLPEPVFKNNS